jgi:DNA-binding transcriptional ArsR family regulator
MVAALPITIHRNCPAPGWTRVNWLKRLTVEGFYVTIWLLMKSESMDKLFHALASAPRREMMDIVRDRPGCSIVHVSRHFDVSRIAVMKHLRVLEEAGLIISEKRGRSRQLFFNPVPIQQIHERWTTEYSALCASQLIEFKRSVERPQK